jgi:molybdopterin synthase catalytic subunit
MIIVQEADFDGGALVQELRGRAAGQAGAIVTFTGYVRDYSSDEATETLHLEHYPGMCERELQDIADEACQRWHVTAYSVVHRHGALPRNAQIVFVGAASPHRGDAFRACEFIIDALKTRAPFWKRETLSSGRSFWVEARHADQDRTRSWESDPHATSKENP